MTTERDITILEKLRPVTTVDERWPVAVREAALERLVAAAGAAPEGQFFFWYEANDRIDPPTLVGYDAAGKVLAERPLPDLAKPPYGPPHD